MNLTIGQRISTRGEDFIITDTKPNYDGSFLIQAEGISELVKGKRFSFDSTLDTDIKPLDPNSTVLIPDTDSYKLWKSKAESNCNCFHAPPN
jgi:hypothetical protein